MQCSDASLTPSREAPIASSSWIFMSVAMGKLCFFASSAIASQTSGRLMNTLRPAAPCCLSRLTRACASSGVFAPATAYGMMVGAEICSRRTASRAPRSCRSLPWIGIANGRYPVREPQLVTVVLRHCLATATELDVRVHIMMPGKTVMPLASMTRSAVCDCCRSPGSCCPRSYPAGRDAWIETMVSPCTRNVERTTRRIAAQRR